MAYAIKNFSRPLYFLPILLLVPLIAMQFTEEVNWSVFDFVIMGILLFALGSTLEYDRAHVKVPETRIAFIFFFLLVFFLIWAQLAVGLLGKIFAAIWG